MKESATDFKLVDTITVLLNGYMTVSINLTEITKMKWLFPYTEC